MQEGPQYLPARRPAPAAFTLQEQRPFLRTLVKDAVADMVKDVVLAPAESPLQRVQGSLLDPLQYNAPPWFHLLHRPAEGGPFPIRVHSGLVLGTGNHHQDL